MRTYIAACVSTIHGKIMFVKLTKMIQRTIFGSVMILLTTYITTTKFGWVTTGMSELFLLPEQIK